MSIYDADDCLSTNLLELSTLFNGYLSIENTYRGIDIYDYKYDGEEEDILHPIKKGDIKDIEVKEIKIHPNIDDWIFDDYEVISISAVRADFSEHLSGELINYESESSRNRSDTIDSVSVYDTESVNSSIKYVSNYRKSVPLVVNEHEEIKKRINSERIIPIKEVKDDNISSVNDINMIRQDTVIISKGRSRTLSETGINRSLKYSNSENSANSLRIRKTNSDFSANYDKIIESIYISGSESNKEKEYIDKEKKQDEKEKSIEKLKEKKENKEMREEDKREEEKVMDKSKENKEKDEKDSKKNSIVNSRKSSIHIIIEDEKEPENSNIKPETITEESITPSSITIDKDNQKNDSDSDTPFSYEKKFFHINRSSSDFTDSDIIRDNTLSEPPLPNRVLEIRKSSLTYNSQSRPASPSTFIRNNRVLDTNDLVYSPKLGSMSSYVDSPVNRRFSSMTDLSLTDESDLDGSNMSLNNEKKVEIKENEKVEIKDEKEKEDENTEKDEKEDEKDEKESKNKEIIDNK